jgi:hypothetical protein
MIFPKITSVPFFQLPTDASELTQQEDYLYKSLFNKTPNAQSGMVKTSSTGSNADPNSPLREHSLTKKILISIIITAIIVIYSYSPIPCILTDLMKKSISYTFASIVILLIASFFFLTKFIK